jgi:haloacetate dehalogenase
VWYLNGRLGALGSGFDMFHPDALAEYRRCFADPTAIHASCEDYRAAATIDLAHDEADMDTKIACPLLVLWGGRGLVDGWFDTLAVWRERAADVRGGPIDAGHYLAEEKPEETTAALLAFLSE